MTILNRRGGKVTALQAVVRERVSDDRDEIRLRTWIRGDLTQELALARPAVILEREHDRLAPCGVAAEVVIRMIEQQMRAERRALLAAADRRHRIDDEHEVGDLRRRCVEVALERGQRRRDGRWIELRAAEPGDRLRDRAQRERLGLERELVEGRELCCFFCYVCW